MDSSKESSLNSSPQAEIKPPSPKISKSRPELTQFTWVEIKPNESVEVNYLERFLNNCTGSTIDFRKLDIPKADTSGKDHNLSFDIASIHTRLSKWGALSYGEKKEKNKELNYDLEDSFIDDNEGNVSTIHNPGVIESVFEDFVTTSGNLERFRASLYYQERIMTIKKSLQNDKVEKKKKKVVQKDKRESPKDKEKKKEKSEKKESPKEKEKAKKREKSETGDKENKKEKSETGEKEKKKNNKRKRSLVPGEKLEKSKELKNFKLNKDLKEKEQEKEVSPSKEEKSIHVVL